MADGESEIWDADRHDQEEDIGRYFQQPSRLRRAIRETWYFIEDTAPFFLAGAAALAASAVTLRIAENRLAQPPHPMLLAEDPEGELRIVYRDSTPDEAVVEQIENDLLPMVEEIYGPAFHDITITIEDNNSSLATGTLATFTTQQCAPRESTGTIILQGELQDSLYTVAHELPHASHGCFTLTDRRLEEGIAYATEAIIRERLDLSIPPQDTVVEEIGVPDFMCCFDQAANRDGIGGGILLGNSGIPILNSIRINQVSRFFVDFETSHPGFIRRFNAEVYNQLRSTGNPELLDPVWIANNVEPDFIQAFYSEPVFQPRRSGGQLLILPFIEGAAVLGIQRTTAGDESPLVEHALTITIVRENDELISFEAATNEQGIVPIRYSDYGLREGEQVEIFVHETGNEAFRDSYTVTVG